MKKVIIIFLILLYFGVSYSQIDFYEHPNNKPDSSILIRKFLYGGNLGLDLGGSVKIYAAPKIAYPLTNYFTVGTGVDGLYYADALFRSFMYGTNAFAEIFTFKYIVFHAEYALMNVETFKNYPNFQDRVWNTAYYAGVGYRQMITKKAYLCYLILWDFNYSETSIFNNPVFRFTFYF